MTDAKIGGIPGAAITIFVSVASAEVGAKTLIVHSAVEIATILNIGLQHICPSAQFCRPVQNYRSSSAPIIDHDGAFQEFCHFHGYDAGDGVAGAADRVRRNQLDRMVRIFLRGRWQANHDKLEKQEGSGRVSHHCSPKFTVKRRKGSLIMCYAADRSTHITYDHRKCQDFLAYGQRQIE